MSLQFCSFSSGSSGNSYLIKSATTALIVDAGISAKKIFAGLDATGTPPEMLKAILITHEHSDHIKSVKTVAKRMPEVEVHATSGTWKYIADTICEQQRVSFNPGDEFDVGDIKVRAFPIEHDAEEPVGYTFFKDEKQISIVTDTGCITDDIHNSICDSDLIVMEANHDIETLKVGRYPYNIKRRILGRTGHLSNEDAGKAICRIYQENEKHRQIILAHLSGENNFPELAYSTIKNVLEEANYYIGHNMQVHIIKKDIISAVYKL